MGDKEWRRKIETFSLDDGDLGSQGYKRVLLQLFGYSGHGKSSFINSCKYVLNHGGPFREYAQAGQKSDGGSMTMIRKAYDLTHNITIVDNRGFRVMNDFERTEVYAQLGNFYPLNKRVEWKENFDEVFSDLLESIWNPNFTDFLVPIFIFSAKYTFGRQDEENEEDVKGFLENCVKMTGVFPIIVITHKASRNFQDAERKFKLMGAEIIIAIENYTIENSQKTLDRNIEILKVIDKALENVRFRLEQPRDQMKERKERRNFLLDYFHEALEKQNREMLNIYFTNLCEVLGKERREREERERRVREGRDTGNSDFLNIFQLLGKALREQRSFCTIS
ncbi:uncharacterized protein [Aquarana catesbeiana]|uniref:uncharacterized protein n=1 Tax=Aquarana catesbeiana TaxID=8400 RepID=UPI003CCA2545